MHKAMMATVAAFVLLSVPRVGESVEANIAHPASPPDDQRATRRYVKVDRPFTASVGED